MKHGQLTADASTNNIQDQPYSKYKHSLIFRVRHYTHLQYIRLTYVYAVITMKPVHRLQICHIVRNYKTKKAATTTTTVKWLLLLQGTPYHSPKLCPGPCNSVGMRQGTDRQTHTETDTQMTMANIHFTLPCLTRNVQIHK